MKKTTIKLSYDLVWELQRDKPKGTPLDVFVRELYEFWKTAQPKPSNKKI